MSNYDYWRAQEREAWENSDKARYEYSVMQLKNMQELGKEPPDHEHGI